MTTNITVRYATDIKSKNEIANFNSLGIKGEGISAVSWEQRNTKRSDGVTCIISQMVRRLSGDHKDEVVYMYIQLSGYQSDSSLIKYKKTWGLLQSRGYDIDLILDKKNIMTNHPEGLVLSGTAFCYSSSLNKLSSLIDDEKKIFFACSFSDFFVENTDNVKSESEWMNIFWSQNGVVFMPLGALDEKDCEVVAFGKESTINILR
ncbi:hypothetical protein [Yersinia wautersii]|uniref:hypothetical protein n=1 Tax=Yersinia wautersii TaxID=1341643 RepID=UPI000427F7CD|nr:hypothetical protein [Yersinia wautersii]